MKKSSYSRQDVEDYLCSCQGWEPELLKEKRFSELLIMIDNPQDLKDYLYEVKEYEKRR